jgi:hypothetical protein
MDISSEATGLENKIGEGFEWLRTKGGDVGEDLIGPGGRALGEAFVEAAPFAIPAVRPTIRGIKSGVRGAGAKIRESMSGAGTPELTGKTSAQYFREQYGTDVPSPVTNVARPPISEQIAQAVRVPPEAVPPVPPPVAPAEPPKVAPEAAVPKATPPTPPIEVPPPPRTPKRYKESTLDVYRSVDTELLKVLGGNMENPIYAGWRRMEAAIPIKKGEYDPITIQMGKVVKKMTTDEHNKFKTALLNNETVAARKIFTDAAVKHRVKGAEKPEALFDSLRPALDTRYKELATVFGGKNTPVYTADYFPRRIKDLEGFKKELAKDAKKPELAHTQKLLQDIEVLEAKYKAGEIAPEFFRTELDKTVLNRFSKEIKDPTTGHVKAREYKAVPEKFHKYYAEPIEALGDYFNETAATVVERSFLGKGAPEEAISSRMVEAVANGVLSPLQAVDVAKLMKVRFSPQAIKSPGKVHTALRDTGYLGTIANPLSAAIQIFDLLPSSAKYGVWNTVKAAAKAVAPKALRGKAMLDPSDVGLRNIAHDIVTESGMRGRHYMLSAFMKASGFQRMDVFGKRALMQAALNKFASVAKSRRGDAYLTKKGFRNYYRTPEEWASFKEALAKRDIKDVRVQEALVMELMDIQPLSLSAMPIAYLKHPKGRIFYMLKTWAIRQLNAVRSEVIKGNYGTATKLLGYLYMSNLAAPVLRDTIRGLWNEEPIEKTVPERMLNAVYRSIFLDKFGTERALKGKFGPLISSILDVPPVGIAESMVFDVNDFFKGGGKRSRTLEYAPIFGPMLRDARLQEEGRK